MPAMANAYLAYKRAKFATRLPADRLFTAGHFWLAPEDHGVHRVGFTKFATRMLGEAVEFEFEVAPGAHIEEGQTIGWFEGFKAISELYAPLAGRFVGPNPLLERDLEQVHKSPYDKGWLYRVEGPAPAGAMDASGYAAFLDGTIDRMMGRTS
jgi:glycine cleavage system H protein